MRASSWTYGRSIARAERAVEADGERPRVAHAVPERADGLAATASGPTASVIVPLTITGSR